MPRLTRPEQLDALRQIDSPTVSNAIERFRSGRGSRASPGGNCVVRFRSSGRWSATR